MLSLLLCQLSGLWWPEPIVTTPPARNVQLLSGLLGKETSHRHIWVGFCLSMSLVGCDIPLCYFPHTHSLLFEERDFIFPSHPPPYFTKTCLSGQRSGKRLILHCKKHRAEYFSFDVWDVCYNIAVFLNEILGKIKPNCGSDSYGKYFCSKQSLHAKWLK